MTQNFTVEFAYRYLNYGSVTDTINCTGGCNPDSYKLQNLSSNDFMLGMRWRFPIDTGRPSSGAAGRSVQQPRRSTPSRRRLSAASLQRAGL